MAEEGFGLQVSLKEGGEDPLFNARGADADELCQIISDLVDKADEDEIAAWIVEKFGIGEDTPKPKKKSRSSGGKKSSRGGGGMKNPDGDPSEKQLDFAKQLKIRGASKMTKAELSEAIDEALAKRGDDDDDDD